MIRQGTVALLGRADAPTDAVEEYCRYLGEALRIQGFSLAIERVAWAERGWRRALRSLRRRAKGWRGMWVLVQYTSLAWSARGFPLRFPRVLQILQSAGLRIAVVYHDVEPRAGKGLMDPLRKRAQLRVMRKAIDLADAAIFTVPMERLSWVRPQDTKAIFIPVGANFPTAGEAVSRKRTASGSQLSVAVFGFTGGRAAWKEIGEIAEAVRFAGAWINPLKLVVLGRNSREAEAELRKKLKGASIDLQVLGVLSSENVVRSLSGCDVLLFVRGAISTRRSSTIAGIACGLPVIAFEGPETAPPITEAGVAFYSPKRKDDLGQVLLHVLQDEHFRASLAQQSWVAQQRYFSWTAIARQYAALLGE